jgi:hypothetical protein
VLTLTKKRRNLLLISACFAGQKARRNDAEKRLPGFGAGATDDRVDVLLLAA